MKILINDANILIDIVKLDLTQAFLSLTAELYTTDFVFAELQAEQQVLLVSPMLTVIKTESMDDFLAINTLVTANKGLSFEDCSVWHYSRKLGGTLITGDGLLRKNARKSGIDVKGILFIIDEFKMNGLLPVQICVEKLKELKTLNNRLPLAEIDKRIHDWSMEL